MSKIVISGYYGFANAGDEAMLTAIVESLRQVEPQVELTVLSGNPQDTAAKHSLCSIYRFNPLNILKAIHNCDLVLSGGGSLLQDVTSYRSLFYYLSIIALGKIMGKKVMLFAQGIGPIRNNWARKFTKLVCSEADLITVRDKDSADELINIGVPKSKVEITADSVLALHPVNKDRGKELLHRQGIDTEQHIIAISVRQWPGDERCLQEIAKASAELQRRYQAQLVLLPLQYPADVSACEKLRALLLEQDNVFLLNEHFNTEEFLSVVGNFNLLIGMRLHALVFAAVMHIPLLAVSYDPKVDSFIDTINGIVVGKVEDITAEDIVFKTDQIWGQSLAEQNEKIKMLRIQAEHNSDKAFELLGSLKRM